MFLRATRRVKDGKDHRYWSLVENQRTQNGKVVQRHVLYLGEINDSQKEAWCRTIEVFEEGSQRPRQVALFPQDRPRPASGQEVVQVQLDRLELHSPRQWGACWLACQLWEELKLDEFWAEKLPPSREGTRWLEVLKTLVSYQLLDPGSEWRLHREWYRNSAMGDLLGEGPDLVEDDKLYRCLDKLLRHKEAMFSHLRQRWQDLFAAGFEVLLYDLTSTYFECDPPRRGKRKYGYSRDRRSDCVQVVMALIVTPQGLPLAYEVMDGNTSDKTTLPAFLKKIEQQYGKAQRIWVMDRGIPTEDTLQQMRQAEPPISYLVGTPRGHLTRLEKDFLALPWEKVRGQVEVKLIQQDREVYVLARSVARTAKERGIRRRRLKQLWKRLKELQQQKLERDQLLLKLGAAKTQAGKAYRLVEIRLPGKHEPVTAETFTFRLNKQKLRLARRSEGRYLLRCFQCGEEPARLWEYYVQLTEIEQVFRELKGDLAVRPIFHQKDQRIEAHIFVAFTAYCLQVTLKQKARSLASGLTPRSILEKFRTIQMVDVHLPTTDGRKLILPRYTQPDKDLQLLLHQLKLKLPAQPPPKILDEETRTG
jgi:transposase